LLTASKIAEDDRVGPVVEETLCEFQNGIVPEWEEVTGKGLGEDFVGFGQAGVLYWE
jgi:hypothetical protein